MKILVTGGLGFIGYKFSNFLKSKNHDVHILDSKFPKVHQEKQFKYFIFDMREKENFNLLDKNYDYIFHFAAQSGGYYSLNNPQEDCLLNCLSTVNLVEYCKKYKPKKIFYSSSMAVYGNGENLSELSELNPISFYGVSKLAGENYIKLCFEQAEIPYTILRLFATYGSGQDLENPYQGIVSIYLKQALSENQVKITGLKNRVRSLVHVEDVCSALDFCMNSIRTDNEIYNILFDEDQTPEKIINTISKKLGKDIEIIEEKGYIGDQTYITGCSDKIKKLGWFPIYNLEKGIEEFCKNI